METVRGPDHYGVSPMWRVASIILSVALVAALVFAFVSDGNGDEEAQPSPTSSAATSTTVTAVSTSSTTTSTTLPIGDPDSFPTGTFESADTLVQVDFDADGSCRWHSPSDSWVVPCVYAVRGDLYTEMTFEWPTGYQVPATYYWQFDGTELSFELWGEDLRPHRNEVMVDNGPYHRLG